MKVNYIELLGEKHPLCFSLAASEEVKEAFGGLQEMLDELTTKDTIRVARAIDEILQIFLRAGRIYAAACGENLPKELPCRPSDLIDATSRTDIMAVITAIMETIKRDTNRTVEAQSKNAGATPGQ